MRYRVRADNLTVCYRKKKQIDVSFSHVCPVIDHEFRHNIVKVFGSNWLSPRGSTATLRMLWRNSWSIIGPTHEKLPSLCELDYKPFHFCSFSHSIFYMMEQTVFRVCNEFKFKPTSFLSWMLFSDWLRYSLFCFR